MSSGKLDKKELDEVKLDKYEFKLDDIGDGNGDGNGGEEEVDGQGGEIKQEEEFVEQGEVSVGQGDKQPDNKRKRLEWSKKFLTEQTQSKNKRTKTGPRVLSRQAEGLTLPQKNLMNEPIGYFTKKQVDDIGSSKRQKKTGGSRKKRSKSKTRSRKQSNTQKRSKSKTRSRKQKRSKNRRR